MDEREERTVETLKRMSDEEIIRYQYEMETQYAKKIGESRPFSAEREEYTKKAYHIVDEIMMERYSRTNRSPEDYTYGADQRHIRILQDIIQHLHKTKENICFYEAGVGSGYVIRKIAQISGVAVAGCDAYVAEKEKLSQLNVQESSVYEALLSLPNNSIDLFYWNDVMEHIPEDEIDVIYTLIRQKLRRDGLVVTCTPNRYRGPHDITREADPRQKMAKGLHLKEYTFGEVMRCYKRNGLNAGGCIYYSSLIHKIRVIFCCSHLFCGIEAVMEAIVYQLPLPPRVSRRVRLWICDDFSIAKRQHD